ncbi:hypothetical protein MMC25_005626 [Agyrium rufum]|nr:hypothetical protein [Agyrium rufum]
MTSSKKDDKSTKGILPRRSNRIRRPTERFEGLVDTRYVRLDDRLEGPPERTRGSHNWARPKLLAVSKKPDTPAGKSKAQKLYSKVSNDEEAVHMGNQLDKKTGRSSLTSLPSTLSECLTEIIKVPQHLTLEAKSNSVSSKQTPLKRRRHDTGDLERPYKAQKFSNLLKGSRKPLSVLSANLQPAENRTQTQIVVNSRARSSSLVSLDDELLGDEPIPEPFNGYLGDCLEKGHHPTAEGKHHTDETLSRNSRSLIRSVVHPPTTLGHAYGLSMNITERLPPKTKISHPGNDLSAQIAAPDHGGAFQAGSRRLSQQQMQLEPIGNMSSAASNAIDELMLNESSQISHATIPARSTGDRTDDHDVREALLLKSSVCADTATVDTVSPSYPRVPYLPDILPQLPFRPGTKLRAITPVGLATDQMEANPIRRSRVNETIDTQMDEAGGASSIDDGRAKGVAATIQDETISFMGSDDLLRKDSNEGMDHSDGIIWQGPGRLVDRRVSILPTGLTSRMRQLQHDDESRERWHNHENSLVDDNQADSRSQPQMFISFHHDELQPIKDLAERQDGPNVDERPGAQSRQVRFGGTTFESEMPNFAAVVNQEVDNDKTMRDMDKNHAHVSDTRIRITGESLHNLEEQGLISSKDDGNDSRCDD